MQDRYVGDVGDFGKYGLLRALRGTEPLNLRLGVVWFRTDDAIVSADPRNDGNDTRYLAFDKEHEYRSCDPLLYDTLREIVASDNRRVSAIEESGLLGSGALFHDAHVPGPAKHAQKAARQATVELRRQWVRDARSEVESGDFVFLDPDNGLEVKSVRFTTFSAPKYVYLHEVQEFFEDDRSVIIYQHRDHEGNATTQFAKRREQLRKVLHPADIFGLYFSARLFIVVATSRHAEVLRQRTSAMLKSPWREHFELID